MVFVAQLCFICTYSLSKTCSCLYKIYLIKVVDKQNTITSKKYSTLVGSEGASFYLSFKEITQIIGQTLGRIHR